MDQINITQKKNIGIVTSTFQIQIHILRTGFQPNICLKQKIYTIYSQGSLGNDDKTSFFISNTIYKTNMYSYHPRQQFYI